MTERTVPRIFDRRRTAAKWARSRSRSGRGDAASFLADAMADDIAERIDFMRLEPGKALVIGDDAGRLRGVLDAAQWDGRTGILGEFEEESPGPPRAFDLIVHLLGLGMVNDLPGALIHARNALSDGGIFFAAFPGAGSLRTLRSIVLEADGDRPAARMHPQVDNRAGTALLERAGFARQVVDSYPLAVRYGSFARLVEDLRDHGLSASLASPAPPLDRQWLARAEAAFDALREDDGKVTETFEILTLTGWR